MTINSKHVISVDKAFSMHVDLGVLQHNTFIQHPLSLQRLFFSFLAIRSIHCCCFLGIVMVCLIHVFHPLVGAHLLSIRTRTLWNSFSLLLVLKWNYAAFPSMNDPVFSARRVWHDNSGLKLKPIIGVCRKIAEIKAWFIGYCLLVSFDERKKISKCFHLQLCKYSDVYAWYLCATSFTGWIK